MEVGNKISLMKDQAKSRRKLAGQRAIIADEQGDKKAAEDQLQIMFNEKEAEERMDNKVRGYGLFNRRGK